MHAPTFPNAPRTQPSSAARPFLRLVLLAAAIAALAVPVRAQDVPWRMSVGLDQTAYEAQMAANAADGYRPVSVAAHGTPTGLRFDAAWAADGVAAWRHAVGLTRAQAQAWVAEQAAQGYKATVIAAYNNPTETYALVAVFNPGDTVVFRWGQNSAQLDAAVSSLVAQGYRGIWITSWMSGSTRLFTAAFTDAPSAGWWIAWGQTLSGLQNTNQARRIQGARMICIASDGAATNPAFSALWAWLAQPERGWREFFAQTREQLEATAVQMTAEGFRPTTLTGYNTPGGQRYHSAWIGQPIPHTWRVTGREIPELAVLDDAVRDYMETRRVSAAQLAVTHQGRLVFNRAYTLGPEGFPVTQVGNRFRIASVTKPTTATAIMQLVETGLLSLEDRMTDIIPGSWSDARVRQITVRDLLRHSGGWNRNISGDPLFQDAAIAAALGVPLPITQDHIIQYMRSRPLDHAPGTGFYYSNFGYLLLGRIVEIVSGQNAEDYVRANLWNPLGAQDDPGVTGVLVPHPNEPPYVDLTFAMFPSVYQPGMLVPSCYGTWNMENLESVGGWAVSARDLARFTLSVRDTAFGGVLTPQSVERMLERPPYFAPGAQAYYGLGWLVDRNVGLRAWHDGALPGTMAEAVVRFDGTTFAVVANVNSYYTPDLPGAGVVGWLNPMLTSITEWPSGDLNCPADFTFDGVLNSDDFFAFLEAYFTGDADYNGDGATTSDDYFAFLGAFFEGC